MAVLEVSLQKESRDRYLTYALSVVAGRALPDVRDGLKPVQRRILYAMLNNLGLTPGHSFRKSAAVVGEVLARFHPHGDVACYEAMVRMAQEFSLRYPLVDGQGNFGSLDGDNAAAYRYTEAKLRALALEVIGEIDQETVAFRDNFDATQPEPVVLPSRVPNLLINGASGIAVGMATSIPPHNLREVVKALIELADDPEISVAKLCGIVRGPDFPTGCQILNTKNELNEIYSTGRGAVRMRGVWKEEDGKRGKRFIIITAIPYALNKSDLVSKIADLIIEKKVPQLTDVRDESTDEVRVVLELAPGAEAEVAMAYLFRHTPLESNFPVNLTALVPTRSGHSKPELLSLKSCLQYFLEFRREVTEKRLQFERRKLLERIHILEGLVIIYDRLDEALKIVRKSEGRSDAAEQLSKRFKLTEIQAFAVVDMRIYQLSRTNIDEIRAELKQKSDRVKEIDGILKSPKKILDLVRRDLEDVAEKYGDKRRCALERENIDIAFNEEDYVVHEDVYAIVTRDGWIKRIRRNNELAGTRLREGDEILRAHPLSTLDSVAFITNLGTYYVLKVADFPASSGYGDPVQKHLKFKDGETVIESFAIVSPAAKERVAGELALNDVQPHILREHEVLLLVSARGAGFALKMSDIAETKRTGKRVMKVREGDGVVAAVHLRNKVALFTHQGSALQIAASEVPVKDSAVMGVALIGVRDDDRVVGAASYDRSSKITLRLASDKEREIASGEVTAGHRALKGNKIVSRDQIVAVKTGSHSAEGK